MQHLQAGQVPKDGTKFEMFTMFMDKSFIRIFEALGKLESSYDKIDSAPQPCTEGGSSTDPYDFLSKLNNIEAKAGKAATRLEELAEKFSKIV